MQSKIKKIIASAISWLFLLIGAILGGISISRFQNYRNPYLFGFLFAILGLLFWLYIFKKVKSSVNVKNLPSEFNLILSIGFIGWFLMLGYYFNRSVSKLEKCDSFVVIAKEFHPGGTKSSELTTLIIDIEGRNERILCSRNYWQRTIIGQKANVCIYSSLIGFDNFDLLYDKR